ncbi:C-terminal binding protein [Escherichia albertii]|uniref:C-terminal binding protein n=1 Tax=Escherichia albertii TaxID=208962 RepID=UPI000C9EDC45|nr:C-terminal binding protein [Escherichia albertii]AUS67707.1 C-terminal binding protein [Escherichia albertii]EAB1454607.1 C-terminal binding protein [Escherichia albertii]EEW7342029.1 C-terminal binding protein [Escherichia albertii]EJY9801195.1 C-terminal binding protein [Escherichia albertii]MCQ8935601.1 C-terminal binding protein [Escherichia albertii]
MKKIVVIEPGYLNYSAEENILQDWDPQFVVVPANASLEEKLRQVSNADAIMVREATVSRPMIEAMQQCRVIVRYGVGVDNIDSQAAKEKGIYVANVPDYGSEDVAEHALALLLAATRRIATRNRDVRDGQWGIGQREPMFRLAGKILGVVGFGRISRCFVQKASGIGFKRILVVDPLLTDEQASQAGVTRVNLDTLCREADFISLHAPLTPDTHHLIGEAELAKMKPSAVLVNTSRGGLIDEQALINALLQKRIFAAGLDVFESEPLSAKSPLLQMDNTLCTDHTAWFTEESVVELQSKAAHEVRRAFEGEHPLNWVNP